MDYIIALLYAFGLSFVFMLPPGMLNMATIDLSIKKGFKPALFFGIGAAFIEFWQSLMVIKFSDKVAGYLDGNMYVKYIAVAVFVALALSFLFAKPNQENIKANTKIKNKGNNTFFSGVLMAFANVLVYPFWLVQGIIWTDKGIIDGSWTSSIIFCIGIFFGSIAAYLVYIKLGHLILEKFDSIAKNLNKILAVLFFGLAAWQLVEIFMS